MAIESAIEKSGRSDLPSVAQLSSVVSSADVVRSIDRIAQCDNIDVLAAGFFTLGKALMTSLQEQNKRTEADNKALCIEFDKSKDWYSIKRMEALTGAKFSWHTLKRASIAQNIPIQKMFNQNYESANAYHVDVWISVYGDIVDNAVNE